jgi:hypothetical protein
MAKMDVIAPVWTVTTNEFCAIALNSRYVITHVEWSYRVDHLSIFCLSCSCAFLKMSCTHHLYKFRPTRTMTRVTVMTISVIADDVSHVITAPSNSCSLANSGMIDTQIVVAMPPTLDSWLVGYIVIMGDPHRMSKMRKTRLSKAWPWMNLWSLCAAP